MGCSILRDFSRTGKMGRTREEELWHGVQRCRVLSAVLKVGMHSLVWVTCWGGDNNHQLTTVTLLCSLHRGSSNPQRCCWKNHGADPASPNHSSSSWPTGNLPVPTPLLLLSSGRTKTVLCSLHAPLDISCLLLQPSPSCSLGAKLEYPG